MFRVLASCMLIACLAGSAGAEEKADEGDKLVSGMSIVGNDEAPKALVIVPWKSSELGDIHVFSKALDDSRSPVDRDVFERALHYYRLRSVTLPDPAEIR